MSSKTQILDPIFTTLDNIVMGPCLICVIHLDNILNGIKLTQFKLTTSRADSFCYLRNGSIFKIRNISFAVNSDNLMLIGQKSVQQESFFGHPYIDSAHLGIFIISLAEDLTSISATEILQKGVVFPYKDGLVVFPLIHTSK
uniref:Uncharacterized protein n=1 Tax=Cacopsylla melanoneura TaxID=428564 RepID=A0A8D8YZ88_9HEMI